MNPRYDSPIYEIFGRERQSRFLMQAAQLCNERQYWLPLGGMKHPTPEEWDEREGHTKHDIAAWVELVRERLPQDLQNGFHRGLTSSDLVDTALAFALGVVLDEFRNTYSNEAAVVARFALKHRDTTVRGRTHGQAAEFTSVGRRVALDLLRLDRSFNDFEWAMRTLNMKRAAGPVGVSGWAQIPGTQVAPRDGIARLMGSIVSTSLALEQIALNVRLMARWPEQIVWEERGAGFMGSSSMPDKNNPVAAEQVCGLAGVIRAQARAVQDSSVLWEERDISHSSVERTAMVEALALTEYCLRRLGGMFSNLQAEAQEPTLTAAVVMDRALDRGYTRPEAYEMGRKWARGESIVPLSADGARLYDSQRGDDQVRLWYSVEILANAENATL